MTFPDGSAFEQARQRDEQWRTGKHEVIPEPVIHDQPESTRTANVESLYHDIDRACSLLEGYGGTPVPQGSIREARNILERLRDDLYASLR